MPFMLGSTTASTAAAVTAASIALPPSCNTLQARRRCQRLAGGDHAVAADRGRSRAADVAGRPITGLDLLGGRGGHDQDGSGED